MLRRRTLQRKGAALTGAAAVLTVVWALGSVPAAAGSLSGTLYRDPTTQAARWVSSNPNDSRAALIRDRIAAQPMARWMSYYEPSTVVSQVSSYVSAAKAQSAVPQLVVYQIPNRDCGGPSAGGAPTLQAYQTWIEMFAGALGGDPVIVILEPDSLALWTCLNNQQSSERTAALSKAVTTIKAKAPQAKVYLDAGHSAWNSPAVAADRLRAAGVLKSDGFYSNVSNFHYTNDEINFGRNVLAALGNNSNMHQVIDTGRNGNGPAGSQWCDPSGRKIGSAPTLNTGQATVDAFLWVKPPGEADGCAATAGTFVPDLAYKLAGG
ncbi:MAG: endoglucanase [Actinomycetota bacterium]|nr:endoglucanase [Actinomycetota bacterium]